MINLIIQIKGNVKYPITLDPSVWIFDDRKILLEDAFKDKVIEKNEEEFSGQDSNRVKPQVHNSIKKYNKDELLHRSYVMPIYDFIGNAEINEETESVQLETSEEVIDITIDQLNSGLLLFSIEGKQIKENGPAYFLFGDGSNQEAPIKGLKVIHIL